MQLFMGIIALIFGAILCILGAMIIIIEVSSFLYSFIANKDQKDKYYKDKGDDKK